MMTTIKLILRTTTPSLPTSRTHAMSADIISFVGARAPSDAAFSFPAIPPDTLATTKLLRPGSSHRRSETISMYSMYGPWKTSR
jgi:hypothetical protein